MASDELRVPIGIPVETNASAAADSIQALRDSVTKSKDAIKESAAAMRDLRGKSDEVKAAKDQLTAKIRAEEAAVTKATLQLAKQGTTYEALAKKEKAAGEAKKALADKSNAMGKAISTAGGPVASLKDKLGSLGELLGGTEGGMAAVVGIAALAAAAIVAVGVAAAGAAYELAKFIIVSADAARMMQLTRKANLNGNDQWAKNLGDQVDRIARTVPIAKEKLNELGISLAKSRIGGQTMVDSMEAISGATAAAGEDLGNKLKGLIDAGAITRRFRLDPQELRGMDLDFEEVAQAYATGMHVSLGRAKKELTSGRMSLADGAKALKDAVNAKFGGINAEKMLGLGNQFKKLTADLAGLAKDVNLTPILKGIKSLADNFDQANVNGVAMKHIVETIGKSLGITFTEGVPKVQDFIDHAVLGALKLEYWWLRAKHAFAEAFGTKTSLEFVAFKAGLEGVGATVLSMVPGLGLVVTGIRLLSATWTELSAVNEKWLDVCVSLKREILAVDWESVGSNVIDGIRNGLESGATRLVNKVKGLADDIKKAFTDPLDMHSPSKVFEAYGKNIPAGAEQGIEAGTPAVHAAAAAMAPTPGEGGRGAAGGGGSVVLHFSPTIVVQGGGGDVTAQLKDPSLLQALYQDFIGQIRAAGIEVPA